MRISLGDLMNLKCLCLIWLNNLLACGSGHKYDSTENSTSGNDLPPELGSLTSPENCLALCNGIPDCHFWDYGNGECRLLKGDGNGPKDDLAYAFGEKNCAIGMLFMIKPRIFFDDFYREKSFEVWGF